MAISRNRKEELVAQYTDLLEQSRAVFLAEYSALTVKQMEALRDEVLKADGRFHVTKNTLFQLALQESGQTVPDELLIGQIVTGFALGEVPTLAKTLVTFAKNQETLAIRGAIFNGSVLSAEQVRTLADLPSLDELRAQILGLLNAPARNVAGTVAGGVRQIMNVLNAYATQEEGAGE